MILQMESILSIIKLLVLIEMTSTGISLNFNVDIISITSLSLPDGSSSTTDLLSSIILTVDSEPIDNIHSVVLSTIEDNSYTITFSSCSYVDTTITCSNPSKKSIGGEYTIYNIIGAQKYDISINNINNIIVDRLGIQYHLSQFYIPTKITSFHVVLASDNIATPSIYVEDTLINTCNRNEDKKNILICEMNDSMMPNDGDYTIEYIGTSNQKLSTGITITKKTDDTSTVIQVIDIYNKANREFNCITSETGTIIIQIGQSIVTAPITVVLSPIDIDSDNNEEITIECRQYYSGYDKYSCPTQSLEGNYIIKALQGAENEKYNFSDVLSKMQFYFTYEAINYIQVSYFFYDKTHKSYYAKLPKYSFSDNLYQRIGSDYIMIDNCKKRNDYIICNFDDIKSPTAYIFFKTICGNYEKLNINVFGQDCAPDEFIKFLKDDNTECSTKPIETVIFESETNFEEDLSMEINIYTSLNEKNSTSCILNSDNTKQYKCDLSQYNLGIGTYTLYSVNNNRGLIDLTKLQSRFVKVVPDTLIITNNQILEPSITSVSSSFTINISEESQITPNIFIGNDKNNQIVKCTRAENVLTCLPEVRNFLKSGEYEVYYSDYCDELVNSGITIHYQYVINAIAISLPLEKTCSLSSFAVIIITTDIPITREATNVKAKIVKVDDSDTTYEFNTCESTEGSTTITCTTTSTILRGEYKLDSITGDDLFVVQTGTSIKYVLSPIEGKTQATSQIVKKKTPSFKILLESSSMQKPNVYVKIGEENKIIECSKEDANDYMECTPTILNMPDETSYLIYYEDPCGDIQSTGITVNNILPKLITIQSLSLNDNKKCSQSTITQFTMTTDIEPTGFIREAVLTKGGANISFTCESTGTTITCSKAEGIEEGTYTLTAVNGDDTYSLDSLTEKELKYYVDSLGTQTTTSYTVKKSSSSFKVQLKTENSVKPTIYNGNDENKKAIPCTKETTDSFITCTPTISEMSEDKEYTIYYEDSCGDIQPTGIKVLNVLPKTVTIQTLSFEDDSKCSTNQLSKFKMTFDVEPTGPISKATLTKDTVDSVFTCTVSLKIATCETKESLTQGTFTLKEVIGDDTYILPSEKELKYVYEVLGVQESSVVQVTKSKPTFIIQLKSSTIAKPNIYIGNDESKQTVPCTKETDETFITCTTSDELMPDEKGYPIYYEDQCGSIQSTGITVNKKLTITIKVTKMSITEELTCSKTPFTSFSMSISEEPTGTVSSATFSKDGKEYTFTCGVSSQVITCQVSNIEEGAYHLESVNGDDTYELDQLTERDLKYETEPLGTQTEKSQKIDKNTKQFKVVLASASKKTNIYVEGDKTKQVSCEKNTSNESELVCTPNDTVMPETKVYEIYYEGACGEIKTTEIKVSNVLTSTVNVNDFILIDESTCTSSPFTSFKITLGSQPKGVIQYAIITKDNSEQTYTFNQCDITSTTVTCTLLTGTITGGSYKLTEIEGDDTYILTSIENKRIKYDTNPLGTITATTVRVDKNTKEFTIPLAGVDTIAPKIYIGGDENKKILETCRKEEDQLICDPSDNDMPTTNTYDIYYEGQCGAITNTLIKVHYVLTSTVEVDDFQLEDNSICSSSSFDSFKVTLGSVPKGVIEYAILMNDNTEDTTEYKFTKCEIVSTTVTCTLPSITIVGGSFKLTELEGDDTYVLTSIENKRIKYDDMVSPFGVQTTPQKLNGDKKTFTVVLSSQNNSTPALYLGNDENKEELKCEPNEDNQYELICTPESIDYTKDGEYKVYYLGACDVIIYAGITLNYVAPIQIEVLSLYLSETSTCSPTPITKISFTINTLPTTTITDATIVNTIDETIQYIFDKCTVTDSEGEISVTCNKVDTTFTPGTYRLSKVNGADTYTLSQQVQSTILKYETNPIKEQSNTNPKVNQDTPSFNIELSSEDTIVPKIYVEDDSVLLSNCIKNETDPSILECTPTLSEMSESKEYKIFYEGECGEIKFTGITVNNVLPIDIEVTSITLLDGETCRTDEISSLLISIDKEPTGSIKKAVLTDNTADYEFESCVYTNEILSCTTETSISQNGIFTLKELIGVDEYNIDAVSESTLTLIVGDILGEQTLEQTVNKESPTFTIVLATEETETPNIYIDNDERMECTCEKIENTLVCTLDDNKMPENKEYEIYYKNNCGLLVKTGVTVSYTKEEIQIETGSSYISMTPMLIGGLLLMLL